MRREAGFSLMEMLAALAVLAIAGVALMNALTTSVRASTLAGDAALAGLAADNLLATSLAESRGDPPANRSGPYEIAGRTFDWRLESEAAGTQGLARVTLVVETEDGREVARRTTFVRTGP
ncbi:MAG: type II secretion system minor pseudopilin GspI [Oceanicaulis sp.]